MRLRLAVPLTALALAGCGSGGDGGGHRRDAAPDGSLAALWHARPQSVALVSGTSDYAVGDVRVTFLVVDPRGKPVYRSRAAVAVARSLRARPFARGVAKLEPIGAPGEPEADASGVRGIYVARLTLSRPGRYWLLATPADAKIAGVTTVDVKARSASPALGSRATASPTPTIASTHGNLTLLTTRRPPDRALLRYSIAQSLAAHVPFVVTFATPKFCTSRTCGPVVDVVDATRKRFRGSGVRFIHVEIYRRNDPSLGFNQWVKQWHLPSEPWTFLVGRDGRIAAKFEGSVSVGELSAAIRSKLLT